MANTKKVNKTVNSNNASLIAISEAQYNEMKSQGIDLSPFKVIKNIPKTHKTVVTRKTNLEIKLEAMEAQFDKETLTKYLKSCNDAQGVIITKVPVIIKGKKTVRDFEWVTTLKTCKVHS
tara:strand:- start:4316 stop:4675 length:360 start_codon:yes stop_codon:yes gene_type:complete